MWLSANVNSRPSGVTWRRAKTAPALLIKTSIRLLVTDLNRHAFYLGEACEISKIYGVGNTRRGCAKPREGRLATDFVSCDHDDTSALCGEYFRGYLSD